MIHTSSLFYLFAFTELQLGCKYASFVFCYLCVTLPYLTGGLVTIHMHFSASLCYGEGVWGAK